MWPLLLDTGEEECLKTLRRLELEAYGSLVSALRAQGGLTPDKLKILKDTASALHISPERHRAEIRRAVNDEQLCTIAQFADGPDTYSEWSIEGRRKVRLVPRGAPQTAFLAVAKRVADVAQADNAKMPWPAATARAPVPKPPPLPPTPTKYEHEDRMPSIKKRRRLSQETVPVPSYVPTMTKHRLQKHGISKIQQMYKSQSRVATMRQPQETSIMPPPRTTIKTIPPVKQRIEISPTKMEVDIPPPQKSMKHPIPGSSGVTKNLMKVTQSQAQQKLVIVSASQTMSSTRMSPSLKIKNDDVDIVKSPKILTSQVIVSKSQLTPIQNISEKPKLLTVQAKVRPQGSIIVPLQGQNASSMGVSVPVLQGVQWKAIQGKSNIKLLPISGNTKIIQKQSGSGPIYVMSKPSNVVTPKPETEIKQSIKPQKPSEETASPVGKVLVVRKASPVVTTVTGTVTSTVFTPIEERDEVPTEILKEDRKSTVLQDALRASGVSPVDDDIESQISQYTVIPKNKTWSASAAEDPPVTTASNKTLQNISLQDTKFLTLEEAVAILGDSNETRALLNNLQVDSSNSPPAPLNPPNVLDGQLDPQTGIYSDNKPEVILPPVVEQTTEQSTPATSIVEEHLDIFSSAIASAEIQLENTEYNFEVNEAPQEEEPVPADDNMIIETTEIMDEEGDTYMNISSPSVPLTDKQLADILTEGEVSTS